MTKPHISSTVLTPEQRKKLHLDADRRLKRTFSVSGSGEAREIITIHSGGPFEVVAGGGRQALRPVRRHEIAFGIGEWFFEQSIRLRLRLDTGRRRLTRLKWRLFDRLGWMDGA